MKELPFEISILKRLVRYVLTYHEKMLISSLHQTGFWHQGDWIENEMAFDRTEIRREKRRIEKEINRLRRFSKGDLLFFHESEGFSLIDASGLKYYLQFHHDSIVSWMQVRKIVESPEFRWHKLDSDRQQLFYEDSDTAAGLMLSKLEIDDPQVVIDMYRFLINSCG